MTGHLPRLLVIGAGSRGNTYADYLRRHPQEGVVVGVAEPDPLRRERFAAQYALAPEFVFTDWHAALNCPRFADAVLIATQDHLHVEPAVLAAAAMGLSSVFVLTNALRLRGFRPPLAIN